MWISGSGRTDIIVRTTQPIDYIVAELQSPIPTTVTVAMGGAPVTVQLKPEQPQTIRVPASGVRGLESYAYLLTARSTGAFIPHLVDPAIAGLPQPRRADALLDAGGRRALRSAWCPASAGR